MKLKEILKATLAGGLLLVGYGSSPSFDWESYVNNFFGDDREESRNSYINDGPKKDYQEPAIYGVSGFTLPFEKNRTEEIINPVVSRMRFSDYAGIALCHWPEIMNRIKYQYKIGSPIILLGHSAGCRDIIEVANVLEKVNMPVGALILDASHLNSRFFKPKVKGIPNSNLIPSNVYYIENYVTNGPFGGRNLTDKDFKNNNTAHSKYTNIFINTDHLGLLKEKYIDRYVESINKILEAYKRR